MSAHTHLQKPGWFFTHVTNPTVIWLCRRGIGVWGSRILVVRGRKSGVARQTPVHVLTVDGQSYIMAPRGHVQWTHNLRAAGRGELRLGKKAAPFTATEIADDDKPPLLRAYMKRWRAEVRVFFPDVSRKATEDELRRIAPSRPVFRITPGADAPRP
ncbi:nitroreductase family deazaflavin-dependent oxidoreductase [Streptomyces sp. NPDC046939]|uniref:nitroreductase family deazaflavin-dependent oxidoreductase n=1 Tax=Streptomyces sp. NPDC046939 TaxID=3155376 RepID=UPI00340F1E19